jgi:hypothetical protein
VKEVTQFGFKPRNGKSLPTYLSAAKLLMPTQFPLYNPEFPSKELDDTVLAYPMLDKERLWSELSVLYEGKGFNQVSRALNLHQIIINSGLQNSLSKVYCLLKIILTTPVTTAEQSFSTVKITETFLRSTV